METNRGPGGGRMPALFLGHGSPMNALEHNRYTEVWRRLGETLPRPRAILAISAHWYTPGSTRVTAARAPRTLHDFHGFPPKLYQMRYGAPGDPALAERVRALLAPTVDVQLDHEWGLDHGTWSVLVHVYPQADVPVVQLGMDASRPPAFHYETGRRLAPLRDEGVLLAGFGNVVHNLRAMRRGASVRPYEWAEGFERQVKELLERNAHTPLVAYETLGAAARLSVPTPEHYLPLLYVLGAQQPDESARVILEGIDLASISMLSVLIGAGLDGQ